MLKTPFTKKRARLEHKQNEVYDDEQGLRWLATHMATRFAGVNRCTLRRWKAHCPWLQGKRIRTRNRSAAFNRMRTFYSEIDLILIRDAQATRPPAPEVPGYVSVETVIAELGLSDGIFYKRLHSINAKVKKIAGKSTDGRSSLRAYITNSAAAAILQKATIPADKITRREAAELLGVSGALVVQLISRGKLRSVKARIEDKGGQQQPASLLSRSEVENLRAERHRRRPATAETWSAAKVARSLSGRGYVVHSPTIRKWCNDGLVPGAALKPCESKTGIRDCWLIPKTSVAALGKALSQFDGDARKAGVKLREERQARQPMTAQNAASSPPTAGTARAGAGRKIDPCNLPKYKRCDELYASVEARRMKMSTAVRAILKEFGDEALGRAAGIRDQKKRLKDNAKTYRKSNKNGGG